MNRKDFGQLIASLRQDIGWTQAQLAEHADIDNATLSNIERGAKRHLDPETLFQLANALRLTSLERREFFLGACGLEQEKLVRQPDPNTPTSIFRPALLLNQLTEIMEQVHLPTHLGDCYGDILAVNRVLLEIFQMEPETLKMMIRSLGSFNNLHFVYGMLQSQQALADEYSKSALDSIRAFREGSIRYRTDPYYQEMLKKFRDPKQYPLFERYWRRVTTLDEDKEISLSPLQVYHQKYGTLSLTMTSSVSLTPYGELFLTYFLPMDETTSSAIASMIESVGKKAIRLISWPDKKPLS